MSKDKLDRRTAELAMASATDAMANAAAAGDWRAALMHLIDNHPRGMTGVADDALAMGLKGFGRVYISRVFMRGPNRIERPSPAFVANVWAMVGQVQCPHLGQPLSHAQCQAHHTKPYAQVGQVRLGPVTTVQHWRECQRCPHNPSAAAKAAPLARATAHTQESAHA